MKINKLFFVTIITSLFWACDNSDIPIPTEQQQVDNEKTAFELKWASRLDYDMEVGNIAEGVIIENWYIRSGHYKLPAKLMAFDINTGNKDWEYEYQGNDATAVKSLFSFDSFLICITGKRIFGFDLKSQTLAWELNLSDLNISPDRGVVATNNMFYLTADFDFKQAQHTQHLMEFNIFTGDYSIVYSVAKNDIGYPGISPPAYYNSGEKELLIFNEYPKHWPHQKQAFNI